MSPMIACIAGEEISRQWDAGRIGGQKLGPRETPFGPSGDIFLVNTAAQPFYMMSRHGGGMRKTAPCKVNYRANMYALKDLGVKGVLAWGSAGAITHNIGVGDVVVLSDIIDRTCQRTNTFFEDSPLGFLRQFPVFCPSMRSLINTALASMNVPFHTAGTAAVCEGPRLETPAEVRMLAGAGAELVTHCFVPEVFLAKELQLCYGAVCHVVNYAETGSRHRPFAAGELFAGLNSCSERERLAAGPLAMMDMIEAVASGVAASPTSCDCDRTMEHNISTYGLSEDWRTWMPASQG